MAVITHRLNDGTDKALCGEKLSCVPGADVWHILLTAQDFNNDEITQGTRCAECADIQAAKDIESVIRAAFDLEQPKIIDVHKADVTAAFNIVAERDKEITELRQDILKLERQLTATENELHFAKAGHAPLARQNRRVVEERDVLVDAMNAIDNMVKNAREALKEVAK